MDNELLLFDRIEKIKQIVNKYGVTQKQVSDNIEQLMHKGLADLSDTMCLLAIIEVLTELEIAAKGE